MPAIYLFQRRTLYGGDDLHVLALVTTTARLLQLLCYAVLAYHIAYYLYVEQQAEQQQQQQQQYNAVVQNRQLEEPYDHNEMHLGISLLEFGWMMTADTSSLQPQQRHLDDTTSNNNNNSKCLRKESQHLFPSLLLLYTAAGVVFGILSIGLLARIYHVSSQGCPTIYRHPRTERMTKMLEWLFLPLNIAHFLIWILGVCAMGLAYSYYTDSNNDSDCNTPEDDTSFTADKPSTFFTVLWISSGILLLLTQAVEIFWNALYVFVLYYQDPHALHWTPHNSNSNNTVDGSSSLLSYHSTNNLVDRDGVQLPPPYYYDNNHDLIEQMWAERCQSCCRWLGLGTCYIFGGKELYGGNDGAMHYSDFARTIADYLETRGVLDVVPSDIIVGFLVLQQLQSQRRHQQRQEVLSEHTKQKQQQSSSQFSLATANTSAASGMSSNGTMAAFKPQSTSSVQTPPASAQSLQQQNTNNINPQLYNHRANANGNSPNGMRLPRQRSSSWEDIESTSPPNDLFHTTPPQQQSTIIEQPQLNKLRGNPVLLKSMGAGSISTIDAAAAASQQRLVDNNNNSILFDHSVPPPPRPRNYVREHAYVNTSSSSASTFSEMEGLPPPKSFQRLLSEHNFADVQTLQDGARYSKYALAIYTWYLYLYVHPVTGIPRLCAKAWNTKKCCSSSCCCSTSSSSSHDNNVNGNGSTIPTSASSGSLDGARDSNNHGSGGSSPRLHRRRNNSHQRWEGDNICQAHKHALLLTAGLENEADLVYVQFKSTFQHNPYCILLDHETQAVVVAVRGTFSLEDCVTDVLLEPESLEALGEEFGFADMARGQYCHGGVLACARNVYRDLKRHGSLEYLLGTKYPNYQLRLVGHSLGAATSTVLGLMLRQTYPTLLCFNYSPPGCTTTWDMAIHCQSFCTSFVLDTEVVPRLSFESLEYMRDEILDLIGRVKISKLEVARRVATKTLWCGKTKTSQTRARHQYDVEQATTSVDELDALLNDILLAPHEEPPSPEATSYRQQLEQFQSIQSERRSTRGQRRKLRLFPPGRILHLVKTDEEQSCMVHVAKCLTCCMSNAGSLYTPIWIGNGDLHEIVVSPTMGTDHFPDRMVEELQGIVLNFGLG